MNRVETLLAVVLTSLVATANGQQPPTMPPPGELARLQRRMEFLVELQIRLGLGVGLSQIELDQVQPSHGTLPEVEAKLQQANADHEALRARLASVPTEPRSRLADTAAGTEVDTDAGHAPESAPPERGPPVVGPPPVGESSIPKPAEPLALRPDREQLALFLKNGHWAAAHAVLDALVASGMAPAEHLFWSGVVAEHQGDPQRALQFYQRAHVEIEHEGTSATNALLQSIALAYDHLVFLQRRHAARAAQPSPRVDHGRDQDQEPRDRGGSAGLADRR
jgi:hypothetical protein